MLNSIQDLKPNTKVRLFYNENNINNKIIHIREIVDGEYIVFKIYNKRKGWIYKIEHICWFEINIESLTLI